VGRGTVTLSSTIALAKQRLRPKALFRLTFMVVWAVTSESAKFAGFVRQIGSFATDCASDECLSYDISDVDINFATWCLQYY